MKVSFFAWLTLLVGAYITLLWWTADAHQPIVPPPAMRSGGHIQDPGIDNPSFNASPTAHTPRPAIPTTPVDTSATEDEIESFEAPSDGPPLQAQAAAAKPITDWIATLRASNDVSSRKEALGALLLIGRHSVVDERILVALREAARDRDPEIASAANSALAEVERPMH